MKTKAMSANNLDMKYIDFCGFDCLLDIQNYCENSRVALELVAADTERNTKQDCWPGDFIAMATVNLPDHDLKPGEMFIKNYSENEGILDALVKTGVVIDTGKRVAIGFAQACIVVFHLKEAKKFKVI